VFREVPILIPTSRNTSREFLYTFWLRLFGPTFYLLIREIFSARDTTSKLFVEFTVHCQTGNRVVMFLDIPHDAFSFCNPAISALENYSRGQHPMGIDLEKLLQSYLGCVPIEISGLVCLVCFISSNSNIRHVCKEHNNDNLQIYKKQI